MSKPPPVEDLEDLYETAPCGYVSIAPDGRIVKVNRTILEWLRWPAEELVGKSIHDILSIGARIAVETHLAPLLRMQGYVHEIALDILTADGEKIPTIANAAEKRDPLGAHLFTRLTIFKAVDRRTYERSLLEARAKAEAETKAQQENALVREQFIAVLGHDLRNPLAAFQAGVRMLKTREKLTDKGRQIFSEMDNSVSRAFALIDDVLDLARGQLGSGLIVDRNADAPLTPVLEQVTAEISLAAGEKSIVTDIAIEEPVFCDRGRLGQLVSNLLANAVTHGASNQPIRLEAATEGNWLRLAVANGGEAIPEEVQAHLFEPFFRGGVRPSRHGLGLGLFIASEIAKAHDGQLEVKSNSNETRFTFTMPIPSEA